MEIRPGAAHERDDAVGSPAAKAACAAPPGQPCRARYEAVGAVGASEGVPPDGHAGDPTAEMVDQPTTRRAKQWMTEPR